MAAVTGGALVRPAPSALRPLLQALALPGVGPLGLREAVERHGSIEHAAAALRRRVFPRLREGERMRLDGWVERALTTVVSEALHVLTLDHPRYPEPLRHLYDPPYVMFARGRLELLDERRVTVVGTRKCTGPGIDATRRIVRDLVRAGVVVVSGLARGIDAAAHNAAGPRRTIGVVGSGLDVFYPLSNRGLQQAIGREGLLLSELLPGTPAARHNFPKRNRILAALGEATVVVEAPAKSGALHTSSAALDLGRSVFAVPGPITSLASRASNQLLHDGGQLATGAREVLEDLGIPVPEPADACDEAPPELTGTGLAVWRALGHEPLHAEEVAGAVGLQPGQGLASLLSLEITGHARQLPGLRFVRA